MKRRISDQKILLLTAPMTQINTAYPATTVLTAFLRNQGYQCFQRDFSLELALRVFSKRFLERAWENLKQKNEATRFFLDAKEDYLRTIDPTIRFLQGKDPTLAMKIAAGLFLPQGPRFAQISLEQAELSFGKLGVQDHARYLSSLYLDDIADLIAEAVDPQFTISRYGEKLAASQPSFEPLQKALGKKPSLIDREIEEMVSEILEELNPAMIGLSAPFPGNVYGAFRIAETIKRLRPEVITVLGGGYVNTELRSLKEERVFQYFDFVTLDDGERPLLSIIKFLEGQCERKNLVRSFYLDEKNTVRMSEGKDSDFLQKNLPAPCYDGINPQNYIGIIEMLNPMHRLWSDAFWNKMMLAHGCYWKKCSFCDTSLDYIERYDPLAASTVVDRMEDIAKQTGVTGFHFVDEAAPPALLKSVAKEIIRRGLSFSWWGNIRFDSAFTEEVCALLVDSGCIAVTGGLEVASDRLLALMNKGTTIDQVARVAHSFKKNGVLVHAYLMYGFPTQTEQETIDSLEVVRQLFFHGCLSSAYWHRFSVTAHSPVGKNPEKYKVKLFEYKDVRFSRNDIPFEDLTGCDHSQFSFGLKKAVYNFMHGIGLEADVREWFDHNVPKAKISRNLIKQNLN